MRIGFEIEGGGVDEEDEDEDIDGVDGVKSSRRAVGVPLP